MTITGARELASSLRDSQRLGPDLAPDLDLLDMLTADAIVFAKR
jgi:hypothetical protein